METIILASGSKGNATLIKNENDYILFDIGISYLSLKQKLSTLNIKVSSIRTLLITHEHIDHIKGLKTFIKNHPNIEVIITKGTLSYLDDETKDLIENLSLVKQDETFELRDFNIETFALSHDANEPIGYVISSNQKRIVFATDTGYIDESYYDLLKGANLYILEANHCPEMLMNSSRPFYLKQRILGSKGHLSNNDASWLINKFIEEIDETIWAVAHISEDCNSRFKIEKSIVDLVEDPTKLKVIFTSQETSEVIKI